MAWDRYKASSLSDLIDYLNGVVFSRFNAHEGVYLDSLTLIIDAAGTPRTVTFTPTKSRKWTLEEIKDQIDAAHSELAGLASIDVVKGAPAYRRLRLGIGVAFTIKGNGTANSEFGFVEGAAPANDTVATPIAAAAVHSIHPMEEEKDTWVVLLAP